MKHTPTLQDALGFVQRCEEKNRKVCVIESASSKKTRAKFPSKKLIHKGMGAKIETLIFSVLNTA